MRDLVEFIKDIMSTIVEIVIDTINGFLYVLVGIATLGAIAVSIYIVSLIFRYLTQFPSKLP